MHGWFMGVGFGRRETDVEEGVWVGAYIVVGVVATPLLPASVVPLPVTVLPTLVLIPSLPPALASAALVLGPTAPYPVVAGAPEETIPFCAWNLLTAASVRAPKWPVAESDERRFCDIRNC